MKQQILIFMHPLKIKLHKRIFYVLLTLIVIGTMILLPSFSNPRTTSSSLILPFSKPNSYLPAKVNCKINDATKNGFKATEANFYKMEQAEGVFAKVLHMSLEDGDGNLFALSLTDVENNNLDSCLTANLFYGVEHQKSEDNYSMDIGTTVFSNKSNLVYENEQGKSMLSRNGWVKINYCDSRMISGSFYFLIEKENNIETAEGTFVNVLLQ